VTAILTAIVVAVGAFGANRGLPDAAPSLSARPSIVDTGSVLPPPSPSVTDTLPSPSPSPSATRTTTPTPGLTTSTTQPPATTNPPPTTNPPSPTPSPTPTGPVVIAVPPHQLVITGAPGRCVDVNGGAWANGTTVQSWECNTSAAQRFSFNSNGTLSGGSGFCLAPAGGGAGSPMQVRTCGGANQTWQFRSDKSLFNAGSGLCLNDPGYPGTNRQLTMAACAGAGSQQWTYS
jgi:hypothetical protein